MRVLPRLGNYFKAANDRRHQGRFLRFYKVARDLEWLAGSMDVPFIVLVYTDFETT